MPSDYTDNLGIEKPAPGEQVGSWGSTDNTNYDLFDQAISGYVSVTLPATGSTGSPNEFAITDGTASDGRNPYIQFTDGGDLGGDVYVRLTPNDHKKIGWIENALSGSRDLYVFQGTYNASNDVVIPAGSKALLRFDGGGTGAVVHNVLSGTVIGAGGWTVQNSAATAVLGKRYVANSHSGFALTMPGTFAVPSSNIQDIWVANVDTNSDVTLTPASGDEFYVIGTGLTANTTIALKPGEVAILTPRTADTNWDVVILLMRQSDGDLSIPVGNLVVAAGKGVDFSANTGTSETGAATVSELLDFYETGTWTPTLEDSSFNASEGQTYTTQQGRFVRIGKTVFFSGFVEVSGLGTLTTSSTSYIGGLPYTPEASGLNEQAVAVGSYNFIGISSTTEIIARIFHTATSGIQLRRGTGGGQTTPVTISEFGSTGQISVSGHYTAD